MSEPQSDAHAAILMLQRVNPDAVVRMTRVLDKALAEFAHDPEACEEFLDGYGFELGGIGGEGIDVSWREFQTYTSALTPEGEEK